MTTTVERFAPETIAGVADAVRTAVGENTPLRIVGGGRWLRAGGPVDSRDRCEGRKHGPYAVLAGHPFDGYGRDHARNIGR